MAYQRLSVWQVAKARRAAGLGDDTITDLSLPPTDTSQLLNLSAAQITAPVSAPPSNYTSLLLPQLPANTSSLVPLSTQPITAPVSSSAMEYVLIGGAVFLALLLLSGGHRRR